MGREPGLREWNGAMKTSSLWAEGRLGKTGRQPQIIFAQVREDAAIELEVLKRRPEGETVFCIASGGCTGFSLLLARPAELQMVDVNPAQVFFVELKKTALRHLPAAQLMRALLRDARPFYAALRPHLSGRAQQFWDEQPQLLALGLNQCGVIERRLKQVMQLLPFVQSRRNLQRLFNARSLGEQRKAYKSLWNHWRWKLAFKIVLSKPVLKLAYGNTFVGAIPARFARQVKLRMDEAMLTYPLWENGYLWQTFRGVYPKGEAGLPLYLQRENHQAVQDGLRQTKIACADAAEWLEAQEPDSIGFFALSNILEVTSPEYARRLLLAVTRVAKPGAHVCLRSIFPFNESIIEQALGSGGIGFEYVPSHELEAKDRSFFCKNLRVLKILKN